MVSTFPIDAAASSLLLDHKSQPHTSLGCVRKLLRSVLSPDATNNNHFLLQSLGPWIAPSTMVRGAMMHESNLNRRDPFTNTGERNVAVHLFPRMLDRPNISFYESPPDCYTATVPALATPADLNGDQILTVTTATLEFESIPPPAKTFQEWVSQLPPAEKRMRYTLRNAMLSISSSNTYNWIVHFSSTLMAANSTITDPTHGSYAPLAANNYA